MDGGGALLLALVLLSITGTQTQATYQLSSPTYNVIEGNQVEITLSRSATDSQSQTIIVVLEVWIA